MCGIGGIVTVDGAHVLEHTAQALNDEIRHRGPDGDGVIRCDGPSHSTVLVHRRLAILDTSAAARQPMGTEDGLVWLTYNGEIYNYRSLLRQLESRGHRFQSTGDTQVVLRAYEEWGAQCVDHLDGMYALAIWDGRRQELFAARDRLGIKPFYYFWDGRMLAFCSELRGLARILRPRLTIDPTALAFFATLGYIPAPYSIYREIRKLEPGCWLRLHGGLLRTGRYWDVDFTHKERRPLARLIPEVTQRVFDAVARQLVSDVPIGAFLSGGIDSGGVVAAMAHVSDAPVNTFTIGFAERDHDETGNARLVAERYRTAHREYQVTPRALEVLPSLVSHFGEPFADNSALPTYYLAAATRREVTVALSGDGGDELFCGYTINLGHQLSELYGLLPKALRHVILRAIHALRWSDTPALNRAVLTLRKRLEDAELSAVQRVYSKNVALPSTFGEAIGCSVDDAPIVALFDSLLMHGDASSFLDRIAHLQVKLSLPDDMLAKVDRMSMAHSLEVRVPLLDQQLVEYVATVPAEQRFRHWKTKWLLRKALEPHLPAELLWEKKRGFRLPVASWAAASAPSPAPTPQRVPDARNANAWWARMIFDEWIAQDAALRDQSVTRD